MLEFIEYLKKEKIIQILKKFYKDNFVNQSEKILLENLFENLFSLKNLNVKEIHRAIGNSNNLEYDIFSKLYETTLNHKERKKLGEFYTPISVVNYILDATGYSNLDNIENKKIIDISCGSGSFIIQTIRILINRCLEIYGKKEISELTPEEAKTIISRVKKNISGIDINRNACILCHINIYFVLFEILEVIRKFYPKYQLPLFNIRNFDALTMDHTEKYDYVVGNPPYLFIRDIPKDQRQFIESCDFVTNDGQYDYYQIFLELGIRILKSHGILGYIVPDSLLALSNRSIIRKYVYNSTKIKEIYHIGPKFNDPVVSNIILILEKEPNIIERKKNQIKLKTIINPEKTIPQEIIEKWNYKFLIHLNMIDISIIENLTTKFIRLMDLNKKAEFKLSLSRGVELTKTGQIIYCENCRKYLPIPKKLLKCRECNSPLNKQRTENIIYDNVPEDMLKNKYKLYLYSIRRYQKIQYKYIDTSKVGINYKEFSLYEDRIVIRQLSQNNKICATYEKNFSLTSQSFYNLKIKKSPISDFNHFYLLGILNSMLLSYFFIKSFGTYKKLFPRILIEKIKEFPIKVPISDKDKQKAKKIIEMVKKILKNIDELEKLQKKIDTLVFDLYEISEINRIHILNYMNTLNH